MRLANEKDSMVSKEEKVLEILLFLTSCSHLSPTRVDFLSYPEGRWALMEQEQKPENKRKWTKQRIPLS
jgi:hypothetical protein